MGDNWAEGPRTYKGLATHGYPNMFWLNGPQSSATASATHTLDEIATHIAKVIAKMNKEEVDKEGAGGPDTDASEKDGPEGGGFQSGLDARCPVTLAGQADWPQDAARGGREGARPRARRKGCARAQLRQQPLRCATAP